VTDMTKEFKGDWKAEWTA